MRHVEQFAVLLLASCFALYFNAVFVGLFLIEVFGDNADGASDDNKTEMLRAISALALVLSSVSFLAWELNYGSAFSYFWPLHGLKRIDDFTWRVGIFVKAFFIASLVTFLTMLIMHSDDDSSISATKNFSATLSDGDGDDSLPILSRLSYVDALLVPTCIAFPLIALLIYTAVPNNTYKIN